MKNLLILKMSWIGSYNNNSLMYRFMWDFSLWIPSVFRYSNSSKTPFLLHIYRIMFFTITIFSLNFRMNGQENNFTVNTDWDHERHTWESSWIAHPQSSPFDYGVILFRNCFEINQLPDTQIIYISADNRYRLFINGTEAGSGPARGSLQYWRYETINIGPFLKKGTNIIAAEVFNLGEYKPVAQFSYQTAFILQASGKLGPCLNTGTPGWKVMENEAYHAIPVSSSFMGKYYVAGPCDSITGDNYPWNWESPAYDDSEWKTPRIISRGAGRGYMHGIPWHLVPRNIPPLEVIQEPIDKMVKINNKEVTNVSPWSSEGFRVNPRSRITMLFDHKQLTIGYPELVTEGGRDSKIKVIYSEALYNPDGSKGNRNDISGKVIKGYYDVFMPGGGRNQFKTLWLRTFRFIQLEIETGGESLLIKNFTNKAVRYPFIKNAYFECDDPIMHDILETGWKTARLCALETYMDCPYWEQLQYIGDTRIQSLISLYVSGDDRLMRNALLLADQSRIPEGLTLGRAPSSIIQVSPTFSLIWIWMIHDYFMHSGDTEFLKQFLPGMGCILDWFGERMSDNNLLGRLDWFNFTDWTKGFQVGVPAGADTGGSALISLNYAYALQKAAELYAWFDMSERSEDCINKAAEIILAVRSLCWDSEAGLFSDTPGSANYSQHTNIFAILTGAALPGNYDSVMERILSDTSLIQTTVYYKFYLFEALKKTSLSNLYLSLLTPWQEMLQKGLTTFEEGDYDERSDCHAWSASPCYHFYSLVCGINPASSGFRTVRIEPNPGTLNYIKSSCPHPEGAIEMEIIKSTSGEYRISLNLPGNLSGTFTWNKKTYPLHPGSQFFNL